MSTLNPVAAMTWSTIRSLPSLSSSMTWPSAVSSADATTVAGVIGLPSTRGSEPFGSRRLDRASADRDLSLAWEGSEDVRTGCEQVDAGRPHVFGWVDDPAQGAEQVAKLLAAKEPRLWSPHDQLDVGTLFREQGCRLERALAGADHGDLLAGECARSP